MNDHKVYKEHPRSGDLKYIGTYRSNNGHGAIEAARKDALEDGLPLTKGDYVAVAGWAHHRAHVPDQTAVPA